MRPKGCLSSGRSWGVPSALEQVFQTTVHPGGVHDAPVPQEDDPVCPGRMAGLVGNEQAGDTGIAALAQDAQDLFAGVAVQGAGGFVGEHESASSDQGSRDGDPLLLASGHGVGVPVSELDQAE